MDYQLGTTGVYQEPSMRSLGKMKKRELDVIVDLYLPKGTKVSLNVAVAFPRCVLTRQNVPLLATIGENQG